MMRAFVDKAVYKQRPHGLQRLAERALKIIPFQQETRFADTERKGRFS